MCLRAKNRKKDGKEHRTWSVVENRRVAGGRVVQRHVLYLGEINSSQEVAWRKSIAVMEDGESAPRTYALFPEDRCKGLLPDESIVRLRLKSLEEVFGDDAAATKKRGPAPKLQQQIERIQQLPRTQQRFVTQMLDTVIAQASR